MVYVSMYVQLLAYNKLSGAYLILNDLIICHRKSANITLRVYVCVHVCEIVPICVGKLFNS